MDTMNTGDILLFHGTSCLSCCIECLSCSSYSHVGMVLRDPIWLPKGLYVLESSKITNIADVEDHKMQSGVQIHPFEEVVTQPGCTIYVRHLNITRDDAFQELMATIHSEVHAKPYDMNLYDWVCAEYNLSHRIPTSATFQEHNQFWCSALVAYVYCRLGVLPSDINWSIIAPKSFSSKEGSLPFLCPLSDDRPL